MTADRDFEFEPGIGISELRLEDLERRARGSTGTRALPLRDWIALAEAWRIAQALRDARGNRSAAARALGIGRRTLYSKMDKLSLVPSWGVSRDVTRESAGVARSAAGSRSLDASSGLPRD